MAMRSSRELERSPFNRSVSFLARLWMMGGGLFLAREAMAPVSVSDGSTASRVSHHPARVQRTRVMVSRRYSRRMRVKP